MSTAQEHAVIVDADSRLVEMPDLWVEHTEVSKQHLAMSFGRDDLGYDSVVTLQPREVVAVVVERDGVHSRRIDVVVESGSGFTAGEDANTASRTYELGY